METRSNGESQTPGDVAVEVSPMALRPRLRTAPITPTFSDEQSSSSSEDQIEHGSSERPRKVRRRSFSHINVCGPAFPRSAYQGWQPVLAETSETDALSHLKAAFDHQHAHDEDHPEFTYFTLDQFEIYRPHHPKHANELATLDRVQNRAGCNELLFDGVLGVGGERRYVQGVRFQIIAIEGYGDPDVISIRDKICIQSSKAENLNVWYKLRRPSTEYGRFFEPFLWLAQFTKFFVDFLLNQEGVTLAYFQGGFYTWLYSHYSDQPTFRSWLEQCRLRDFRTTVTANVGFLWKECFSIDDKSTGLCKHPLWTEVDPMRLSAIPRQPNKETKTIVTPFVYDCFEWMYFQKHLEVRQVSSQAALDTIAQRKRALSLTPFSALQAEEISLPTPTSLADSEMDGTIDINQGDVITVALDSKSVWQSTFGYAYVQTVRKLARRTALNVIWLYRPRETTLQNARYPFKNELFMSDHCGCGKEAIDADSVLSKVPVAWYVKDPSTVSGLFVRQKFRTVEEEETYDFISLCPSDFQCVCAKSISVFDECRSNYLIGDTILVLHEDRLEPAQIIDFNLGTQEMVVRRLGRKTETDDKAAWPNELILSEDVFDLSPDKIIRKCHVKIFDVEVMQERLPTPYDRGGAGDFFFIIAQDNSNSRRDEKAQSTDNSTISTTFAGHLPPISQGWDPLEQPPFAKLKGMGIFCGGGNFDRGLEEGGAVEFHYAVDWADKALHTYRANVDNPEEVQWFLGSVSDYLARAIASAPEPCIAKPGSVEFIAAGSPCPGFSGMQPDKQSPQSLQNASMVASVVSFVDFYSPEYCILENVVSMTHGLGLDKKENVFAQIVAALVALGYQVQQFNMNASSYGSPQSRSRVFIVASAPGMTPWRAPAHTHAHPKGKETGHRSLGKSANGLRFGFHHDKPTPFQHVSPEAATGDLPDIGDSQPQLCPSYPDHHTPSEESSQSRTRIAMVPVLPRGMGLVQAARRGLLSGEPLSFYDRLGERRNRETSRTLSRVYPDGLFSTVLTFLNITCYRVGRTLHWNQHRSLTVMELRRALGYLDCEPIVGSAAQQVHIIGNSVDRKVALVLGLALRESWLDSSTRRARDSEACFEDVMVEPQPTASRPLSGWTTSPLRAAGLELMQEMGL